MSKIVISYSLAKNSFPITISYQELLSSIQTTFQDLPSQFELLHVFSNGCWRIIRNDKDLKEIMKNYEKLDVFIKILPIEGNLWEYFPEVVESESSLSQQNCSEESKKRREERKGKLKQVRRSIPFDKEKKIFHQLQRQEIFSKHRKSKRTPLIRSKTIKTSSSLCEIEKIIEQKMEERFPFIAEAVSNILEEKLKICCPCLKKKEFICSNS